VQQQLTTLSQHATQQQAKLQANNLGQQQQTQNQQQQRALHSPPSNQNQVQLNLICFEYIIITMSGSILLIIITSLLSSPNLQPLM
jgi:hypothetical protein